MDFKGKFLRTSQNLLIPSSLVNEKKNFTTELTFKYLLVRKNYIDLWKPIFSRSSEKAIFSPRFSHFPPNYRGRSFSHRLNLWRGVLLFAFLSQTRQSVKRNDKKRSLECTSSTCSDDNPEKHHKRMHSAKTDAVCYIEKRSRPSVIDITNSQTFALIAFISWSLIWLNLQNGFLESDYALWMDVLYGNRKCLLRN